MPTWGAGASAILSMKNNWYKAGASYTNNINQPDAAFLQYDQYRLAKILTRWMWPGAPTQVRQDVVTWSGSIGTADQSGAWPLLHTQVDKDGLFPASPTQMKEHNGYKVWEMRPGKKYSRSYVPSVNQSVSALTSAYRQVKAPWLSTQYEDVNHYGMTWTVDNTLGNVDWSSTKIWVEHWIKFQFRYPKPTKIVRAMDRQIT